ncbi:MAG: tripartite tricarboxylate transporter substrate binding protein [Desulfovibrio sp.]|jgi:tripartite-type tricarboxylate transporter receptor subunit TctC|nr:tripartite tricarboxylate transporter substrate binding protein [Desulfovibrio sp.]
MKKILSLCALALMLFAQGNVSKAAAPYPSTPISLIVAYTPGGATDFQARIASMPAGNEKYFGQPIVIVNKPGAGGMTAWNWAVEKGPKDGYTIISYNMPHLIAQSIVNKPSFTIDSFEALANWGADPAVLIVPKDSSFRTVKEFVEYAKDNPGKITINGAGLFVGHHIATLQLEKATGIKLTYIPEKGGTEAFQAVYSNKVKAGFNNLADAFRNTDNLNILAIADTKRHPFLPDVPTFQELGYDIDDTSVNYRGFCFVKGVPQEIVDKVAKIAPEMFNDPIVVSKMKESGSPLHVMNREETQKMFANQKAKLEVLLKELVKK